MTFQGPYQTKLICDAIIQSARVTMFKRFKFRLQSSEPTKKLHFIKANNTVSVKVALTSLPYKWKGL